MIMESRFVRSCSRVAVACMVAAGTGRAQQQQGPRFQSSVEVTSVDVAVLDDRGRPVTDLQPGDFTVRIDNVTRRVVSAVWVSLVTPERPGAPPPPPGYTTNENATGGRLIVFVVDQPNIRVGGVVGIRKAVNGFIDRLQPSDRIAAVAVGAGAPSTPFTADRELVKKAVEGMTGQRSQMGMGWYNIAISEALAIRRGDSTALDVVVNRECADEPPGPSFELCVSGVESEADRLGQQGVNDGEQTIAALRSLLIGLKAIDVPKTLVLLTEGFAMGDQQPSVFELGRLAAAARTSIYALKLDNDLFDITQRQASVARFADRRVLSEGLDALLGATRGSLFNVVAAADAAFQRIETELSGYYLIGVESAPIDRDGKAHRIRVEVNRRGATVRSRRDLVASVGGDRPRSSRQAAMEALGSPLTVSGLPLRVATFSLQGPDPTKVQLLVHADIGNDYSSSKVVSLGYVILDRDGRIVESMGTDTRLFPVLNGVAAGLQFAASASLPPGEYTLKLAVAEGDRVGTVEHLIHAQLRETGAIKFSELMVGGPLDVREQLWPTIGHTVMFGNVHGYMEAYESAAARLQAKYEIANDAGSPAILTADVQGRSVGDHRVIFTHVMPVRQLPPGKYVLRVIVSSASAPVMTTARDFEVAAPPRRSTTNDAGGASNLFLNELFLPTTDELFIRPFTVEDVARAETVRSFRERLTPAATGAFDEGVALLVAKDYTAAENSFKKAIRDDGDNTAVLVYLAASFAASGHDEEAASAWQTALIDGSDSPAIYGWLSDALMRTRKLAPARAILEEAVGKWPSDLRFAKPLALLYATFGQGREALRTLERHLAGHKNDVEANSLAVEWIYHLHLAGAVAHSRAEDLKLARSYAAVYEKAKGPQLPLVKQWMAFLEKRAR